MLVRNDLGSAIRAYRHENNISQDALGQKIGMSTKSISRIELGNPTVRRRTKSILVKYLESIGVDIAGLIRSANGPEDPGRYRASDAEADRNGFARAVRDYRHDQNLSQAELAKKIGVSESLISKLELGGRRFRASSKARIVKYFKLFHPELADAARSLEVNLHTEFPRMNRRDTERTCDNGSSMASPTRETPPAEPEPEPEPERSAIPDGESPDSQTDKWRAVCRLLARFEDRRVDARTVEQLGELLTFALWKRSVASDKP